MALSQSRCPEGIHSKRGFVKPGGKTHLPAFQGVLAPFCLACISGLHPLVLASRANPACPGNLQSSARRLAFFQPSLWLPCVPQSAPKFGGKAATTHQGLQNLFPIIEKLCLGQTILLTINCFRKSKHNRHFLSCFSQSLLPNDITLPMIQLPTIFLDQNNL